MTGYCERLAISRCRLSQYISVSGEFAFQKGVSLPAILSGAGGQQTLDALTIGAANVNIFAGNNGPYFRDNSGPNGVPDGIIDSYDTPDTSTNPVGLAIGNASFALALMKPHVAPGATPSTLSYAALKATGDVTFIGITGVTLSAHSLTVEVNEAKDTANPKATNTPVVNFAASATADPADYGSSDGLQVPTGLTTSMILDFAGPVLSVSGYVTMVLDQYVFAAGNFAFEKGDVQTVTLSDDPNHKTSVSLLTVGASNVNIFVGTGGPYFQDDSGPNGVPDGVIDSHDTPDTSTNPVGLALSGVAFGLALMKPQGPSSPDTPSYYGLHAEVHGSNGISLVGVPNVTLSATDINVDVNGASGGTPGAVQAVINFLATTWTGADPPSAGLKIKTGPNSTDPIITLDFQQQLIRASGHVALGIDLNGDSNPNVNLGANIVFERAQRASANLAPSPRSR